MSVHLDGVSAEYGGVNGIGAPVLFGVSMSVNKGEVVGVIGPNGAGKSTLIKLLTRGLKPSSGSITLEGRQLESFGRFELARHLAVVPQTTVLPVGFRVAEVVAMGRTPHLGLFGAMRLADKTVIDWALLTTETKPLASRHVETLSGGEKQRVVFARALAQQAHYLLLDEPTNHMDLKYQLDVLAYARQFATAGGGVLVVLHELNLAARSCDRLVVLKEGHVYAQGSPDKVLTADIISQVFGASVRVLDDDGVPVVVPSVATGSSWLA